MEYDPKAEAKPVITLAEKGETYKICEKFKDSIISQRIAKSSWDTITTLLKKATCVKINSKTVQKWSLKIIGYDPAMVLGGKKKTAAANG